MRGWVLGIGGAVVATGLGAGGYFAAVVDGAKTGLPNLDALRPRVAFELARRGLLGTNHMRAVMAIAHNEQSNGKPGADIKAVPETGDLTDASGNVIRVGPSIGNGQVSRALAIRLGLWPRVPGMSMQDQLDSQDDRDAYQAFGEDPGNRGELVGWMVIAYKATLMGYTDAVTGDWRDGTSGDIWGPGGAVRLYNGPGDSAVTYLANATNFATTYFGGTA